MYVCIWCHTRIFVTKQKRNTLTYTHTYTYTYTQVCVKWVDEQSDLADAILEMYQVDTSPENVHLEDDEEERMSTWVNSLTI